MRLTSCQTVGEEGHRHDMHLDNHTQQFTCSDPLLAHLMMHGRIKDHISGLGHPGNITIQNILIDHIQMSASQFLNSLVFFTPLLGQCLNLVFLCGSLLSGPAQTVTIYAKLWLLNGGQISFSGECALVFKDGNLGIKCSFTWPRALGL